MADKHKEERCRKNIATFLDLMGFQVHHPTVTTQRQLLRRLNEGGTRKLLWDCIRENGGSLESTVLVVQKLLTKSDVSKKENRLLMTMHQEFLMAAEKENYQ